MHASDLKAQLLIDGQWLDGTGEIFCRSSPIDGVATLEGKAASHHQVSAAIDSARHAFSTWSETSLDARLVIARRFADALERDRENVSRLISRETGKPLWESGTEISAAIGKVANSVDALLKRRWTTTEQAGDYLAVTRYRPHGVMLVLGPFNLPVHLPGAHIVPALLAGNTLVFKPSELAPATGQRLAALWTAAGLPSGVLNLIHGDATIAKHAVQHDSVDGVLFTGSRRAGISIHQSLAGQPHRILALEMGGNNPVVVHRCEDIHAAAKTIIHSAFITSGQRCTCARRLIVVGKKVADRLFSHLQDLIPRIRVGNPFDEPQPFMGTLVNAEAAERMLRAEAELVQRGADSLVAMRQPLSAVPAMVTPALVQLNDSLVPDDCEHFGPLLAATVARDLDHAIELAGATKFGLSAGFIGQHVDDFHYFLHRVRAGVVNWNRQTTGASGRLPFGGVGESGNHRPSGYHAADYCSYPVASLESHELSEANQTLPGLELLKGTSDASSS